MVRAGVMFGIGAAAGVLFIGVLIPEVFDDYALAHAVAVLATAEQQVADMLSRNQGAKYRVLIADDNAIVREGVCALLRSDDSLEVVAAVDNGRDAVRLAVALQPELAVMELSMPQMGGLSAIREFARRAVPTRTVVLTVHKTEEHVRASLMAGAWGYIVKDASAAELTLAIHSVAQGRKYVSPAVAECIVTGYLSADPGQAGGRSSDVLTPRERQVLKLIAAGRRNREIAGHLSLSVKTVEKHRANLMTKLGLHNTAALTAFAIKDARLST
ncbi:MAG TPA: response regulator transcription factor [Burkholderiales bacterium]|nr:response regulator transcription factor [Burkholderiales bacterium]